MLLPDPAGGPCFISKLVEWMRRPCTTRTRMMGTSGTVGVTKDGPREGEGAGFKRTSPLIDATGGT